MFFHLLEVSLQQGWTTVTLSQRTEAAKLLGELRGAIGASLFEVVDAEKTILIQRGLPHVSFEALAFR